MMNFDSSDQADLPNHEDAAFSHDAFMISSLLILVSNSHMVPTVLYIYIISFYLILII